MMPFSSSGRRLDGRVTFFRAPHLGDEVGLRAGVALELGRDVLERGTHFLRVDCMTTCRSISAPGQLVRRQCPRWSIRWLR